MSASLVDASDERVVLFVDTDVTLDATFHVTNNRVQDAPCFSSDASALQLESAKGRDLTGW